MLITTPERLTPLKNPSKPTAKGAALISLGGSKKSELEESVYKLEGKLQPMLTYLQIAGGKEKVVDLSIKDKRMLMSSHQMSRRTCLVIFGAVKVLR